jgi:hypothetical protein
MIQIRNSIFETNSISTHSITICTPEEWSKLESGDYDGLDERLIEKFENNYRDSYMETYSYETTTPGGEKIRLFGDYGRDG